MSSSGIEHSLEALERLHHLGVSIAIGKLILESEATFEEQEHASYSSDMY